MMGGNKEGARSSIVSCCFSNEDIRVPRKISRKKKVNIGSDIMAGVFNSANRFPHSVLAKIK